MFGFADRLRWTLKTDQFSWTRIVEGRSDVLSPPFQERGSNSRSVIVLAHGSHKQQLDSILPDLSGQRLSCQHRAFQSTLERGQETEAMVLDRRGGDDQLESRADEPLLYYDGHLDHQSRIPK